MTYEQIKDLLADVARSNKELQASQDRMDARLQASQERANAQRDEFKAELRASHQASQQRMDAHEEKFRAQLQEMNAMLQETTATLQRITVAQEELKAAQKKTEEAQQKTEVALQELAAAHEETKKAQQKTDAALQALAVAHKETEEEQKKTAATVREVSKQYGAYINNQGLQTEHFFVRGLENMQRKVAGIQFDELYVRHTDQRKRTGIELDAMLVNGQYVALLEVKTKVHVNDVEAIFNKRIATFRKLFPSHGDKHLLVLIGGNMFNDDALDKARDYGFICLTPDNQKLRTETADFRKY